jgi:hypothetical protein
VSRIKWIPGAGNREVDRQCRLADTALNVTYCENHVYVAFLAFRQPYKVVTPYKRYTLYVMSRKFTIRCGLRYKIIWADGFAAPMDNASR